MTCLENIEIFFYLWERKDRNQMCISFYSDRLKELFPYYQDPHFPYLINYYGTENGNHLVNEFNNRKYDDIIDEIYMLHEMSEEIFAHGICNFTGKIHLYTKNEKIFCTNLCPYIHELYNYMKKDGYKFYSFEEIPKIFLNKKILFKKLYFEEKTCVPGRFGNKTKDDFTHLQSLIKRENLVIFRGDAICGVHRKLTNIDDVKSLFKKYNFVIKDGMSNMTLYEKKIYFNSFINIFLESGGGNCNAFLIDKNSDVTVYTLEASSMSNEFYFNNLPVNVKFLNIGYIDTTSPLYNVYFKACGDPLNEPWKIDLEKLEEILKKL